MKKQFVFKVSIGILFFSHETMAGEINFAGLFNTLGGTKVSQQREIEEKLESDINNFRSVSSSRVVIPVEELRTENIWATSEARVLPIEVILKLKKRRRLTQNELTSISNLLSSSLSNKNQMVQPVIRDEEGFDWTEDSSESRAYFKAASLEHEIWDRLKNVKNVSWTNVHVSSADSSCKIFGNFAEKEDGPDLKIRQNVMNTLGDLCTSARLMIAPPAVKRSIASARQSFLILEKSAYVLLGFAIWGLFFAIKKYRKSKDSNESISGAEDAIILTKIVERSPDQAAKWMVRALMSEPSSTDSEKKKPQIFDQSL